MAAELNFELLADYLLGRARELLFEWLPGGRVQGKEYVCAGLQGGSHSKSLSVSMKTGKWGDFSRPDLAGKDLISLYAKINQLENGEACKLLGDMYGIPVRPSGLPGSSAPLVTTAPAVKPSGKTDTLVCKPPVDAGFPVFGHRSWGDPVKWWAYNDYDGLPLFYVARYQPEPVDGVVQKKQIIPWCWAPDRGLFIQKGFPEPRPLFGLDELVNKPGWPVIIVEGEPSAEGARVICGAGFVVVTWPNGAQAVKKVDWSPLQGRNCIVWPDADRKVFGEKHELAGQEMPYHEQPGPAAAALIAAQLLPIAAKVEVIDVRMTLDWCPAELGGDWDAADALRDGWDWDRFAAWVKPRLKLVEKERPKVEVLPARPPAPPEVEPEDQEEAQGEYTAAQYANWEKLGISLTQQGSPVCNTDNVLRIMEGMEDIFKDFIWWDEFHLKYFTKRKNVVREWQDIDELRFTAHLQREYGLRRISSMMVRDACMIFANKPENVRNEPKDWLDSLVWDKVPRLEAFFQHYYGTIGSDYIRAASKNFWLSLVARILKPGCQVDTMVVLEGSQGAFKTRSLRILGGPWYTDAKESVTTKDFYIMLQGKLVVEISELDSFGKAEVETIKKVISSSTDRFRPPYGRTAQDFPRHNVFVGTTNEDDYLRDVTGGRRFWPVQVGSINIEALIQDRPQLFAEAAVCVKAGEKWYEMPEGTAEMQASRRRADEWETIIAEWWSKGSVTENHTGADIGHYALGIEKSRLDMMAQKRISKAMKALGWKSVMKRINGTMSRCYVPPETT